MSRCMRGIAAWLAPVLVAASLTVVSASDATAQSVSQTLTALLGGGTAQAPASTPTPQVPPDDAANLRHLLNEARSDAAQAAQIDKATTPPAGSTPEEVLERGYLYGELIAALERHLDLFQRLPEAQQRASDQETKTQAWVANPSPPSTSIIAIDHQRELLDDSQARLQAALQRDGFLDQQIAEQEKTLKDNEILVRQSSERLTAAQTDDQRNRQTWLRDLARLRSRTAAASIDEAKAAKQVAKAEIGELRALVQLQQKQLGEMRRNEHFTQAELDSVLAGLDRQTAELQAKRVRLQTASAQSHQLLDQAQRTLADAKAAAAPSPLPADRLQALENDINLRRLRADTDDLAYDTVQRLLEVRSWERAGWQFRWYLFNLGDHDKLREAEANLGVTIQKLDGWSHYLRDEISRISQRSEEESAALTSVQPKADATLAAAARAAYRQRADVLRNAQKVVDNLLGTFRTWDQDFHSNEDDRSWRTVLHDSWANLLQTTRAVWNFELFTAEDIMDVDGQRVTAMRSVTVGKSLGVILLVLLGSVLSRKFLRVIRNLTVRHFGVSPDLARTIARWAHIVIVSMLFMVALYVANIPLTVFAFLGGALAIGIGFGTQVMLKNMISGVILLLERPLRVGDIVEVGNVRGTVTHINVRSSTVRTSDGIEILVPNSTFIENNVTNWTYSNRRVRRSVEVGTEYSAPPRKVEEILLAVARKHPGVLDYPEPCVLLDNFGADAINFTLRYWIDYTESTDSSKIASDLRFMIADDLAAAGIDIPLPQRVVHIKSGAAPQ